MRSNLRLAAIAAAVGAAALSVPAISGLTASATIDGEGNVVVYRVGDGGSPLTNEAAPVFLDEYKLDGTLVESLALPTAASGGQHALTAAGLSRSEGEITRSPDGRFITVTGYDAEPGDTAAGGLSLTATAPGATKRVIGIVDGNNTIDTSTSLGDSGSPAIIRSAVTDDATRFWSAGGNGGILTSTFGAGSATRVAGSANSNHNQVLIGGDQLFASNSSGSRLTKVGSGLPTSAGTSLNALPGLPDTFLPFGYQLLDLDSANYAGTGLDTLYYADAADRGGVIHKYRFEGTSWESAGSFEVDEALGIAASNAGSVVTLVVTTPDSLVKLTDTVGTSGTFSPTKSVIASADANTEFRGVVLAPEDPEGPSVLLRTPKVDAQLAATVNAVKVSVDVDSPLPVSSVTVKLNDGTAKPATLQSGATYTASLPLKNVLSGTHTVTVAATDADGTNTTTRTFVYKPVETPSGAIAPGDASLAGNNKVTVNNFNQVNYALSPNGKGLRTAATGKVSFKFYGRSLKLFYQAAPNAGKARVTIDGVASPLDLYAATTQQTSKTYGGLKLKSHTVVINALGTKRAASTGTVVLLGYVGVGQW